MFRIGLRIPHHVQHSSCIALSERTIARSREMPRVSPVAGNILSRNHMTCRDHLGDLRHHMIMPGTATAHLLIFRLTNKEMYLACLQTQITKHVLIDFLHHTRPLLVTIVRLSLMQQDTLDHTYLLSLLRHLDNTAVRIFAVVIPGNLSPPFVIVLFVFLLIQVLVEHLNRAATHGNSDHTDLLVRQLLHHCAAEIVSRAKLTNRADNRTLGFIPVAQLPLRTIEVTRSQHLEPVVHIPHILRFPLGVTLHVRLSEAYIDIKVRIHLCLHTHHCAAHQHQRPKKFLYHFFLSIIFNL